MKAWLLAGVQRYYTVAQGDSLASIAANFSTTVEAIQAVNPQIPDVNKIAIGQIIAIPQATTGTPLPLCNLVPSTYQRPSCQ